MRGEMTWPAKDSEGDSVVEERTVMKTARNPSRDPQGDATRPPLSRRGIQFQPHTQGFRRGLVLCGCQPASQD